ncbi:coiled-coil domain-containing protein 120 isoform X2 [Salminus brasiliensis]|uniref:coiled-coil domain-containing protein 120 isoform X2 n=1 Tax=Salminus brasiliensis TaxID=930266 RepID=UPI003B830070
MEVKGHLITAMGLGSPEVQDSKLQAERISELQERKETLQTILSSRLGELRQMCLLEAELTGKLPRDFPLEVGERPPFVQRRPGLAPTKAEDDQGQRRQMKTLFSGALRRNIESDKTMLHNKRTVHRGCHTEDTVKSESSSLSDSIQSQDNEDSSPSVFPEHRSLSHPRLAPGSPESRLSRKLSPVEIYYEMRTRRNSASSSVSPSHSLPRSASNVEGRSVPATPLLSRTAPISIHIRSDASNSAVLKPWGDSPDVPQFVPLASIESSLSSSERRGCPYSSRARRSNSSEALLDRSNLPESLPPRNGMPSRAGPYKSSESLTDGKLRQMYRGSPERQLGGVNEQKGRMRSSVGSRGSVLGYNEILMDYIWGKQQKRPVQHQQPQASGRIWPELSSFPVSVSGTPPHYNGFSHSQIHLASAPPPYSPMLLQDQQAEPRRIKVTRTKSCGPFVPLQHPQDPVLLSTYEPPHPPNGSAATAELPTAFSRRLAPFPLPSPDDSTRSLHKALALEGLRDWYLRNALGYSSSKGHEGLPLRHTHHLLHQPQSVPLDPLYAHPHIPQSASFHGHPLHGSHKTNVGRSYFKQANVNTGKAKLPSIKMNGY